MLHSFINAWRHESWKFKKKIMRPLFWNKRFRPYFLSIVIVSFGGIYFGIKFKYVQPRTKILCFEGRLRYTSPFLFLTFPPTSSWEVWMVRKYFPYFFFPLNFCFKSDDPRPLLSVSGDGQTIKVGGYHI